MKYYYPDYFDDFTCVPGHGCPDSCCIRWQITVDSATMRKYRRVEGTLGERMAEKIDPKTRRISPHGEDNRCEFLNEDNLCDIVLELGEEALCETCRTHPRHEEVYLNVREHSLAMTCPIACKQLLEREEPVAILEREEKGKHDFDIYFDKKLFQILLPTRDVLLEIAKDREMSINKRMMMVLGLSHDVESRIRKRAARKYSGLLADKLPIFPNFTEEEKHSLEHIQEAYRSENAYDKLEKHLDEMIYDEKYFRQESEQSVNTIMSDMLFALSTMDALRPDWPAFLQSVLNERAEMSREDSRDRVAEYMQEEKEVQLEQLLVYFLYVYVCTSVYDEQLLAKCKMAVVNVLLIREMWFMRWLENNGNISIDEQAEIAHWYVREIENSDENMEQWDSLMQRNPRFALKKILKVLIRSDILKRHS
ncbi:MAG: flagellin lysine-N-methylase [Lachnospiraceae bacterium]|nr:flagellin lysine-N-methylase [Lachnospiraceae bacterium]